MQCFEFEKLRKTTIFPNGNLDKTQKNSCFFFLKRTSLNETLINHK